MKLILGGIGNESLTPGAFGSGRKITSRQHQGGSGTVHQGLSLLVGELVNVIARDPEDPALQHENIPVGAPRHLPELVSQGFSTGCAVPVLEVHVTPLAEKLVKVRVFQEAPAQTGSVPRIAVVEFQTIRVRIVDQSTF